MKRALLGGATATAVVLLLAGCAKSGNSDGESTPAPASGPMPINEALAWTGGYIALAAVILGIVAGVKLDGDDPNYIYWARAALTAVALAILFWIGATWIAVFP